LGDKISVYQNNEHLDCTALHCSKGEAIEVLRKHFNVEEVCGIGDSFNDLPMFEHVTHSFTFDYSDNEVKKSADYVVKSLNECIKFILNR
jgi:hydroxymethylpyrimidine pyrophosphatase-like HAD family hydrolase